MEIILKLEDSLTTVERYETLFFDDVQDLYNLDLIHIHINFQFNAKENKMHYCPTYWRKIANFNMNFS